MKVKIAAASLLGSMAVLATVGFGTAAAQPGGGGQLSPQDRTFITQNAQTDLAEIAAGKLAVAHATAAPVRQTAQIIMSDHQQVLSQLQGVARDLHVTLPSSPDAMQQQQAQQLEGFSGPAFDHTYVQAEIKGHQMSIAQTHQEISSGSDQQVVQFAKSYLPGAEHHLTLVQALSSSNDTSNGTNNTSSTTGTNGNNGTSRPSGVIAGLGLVVAAGVGSTINVSATPQVGRVPVVQVAPRSGTHPPTALAAATPQRLALPSLRVDAPITPVVTLPGGGLAVPGNPEVLGWWQGGARPGAGQGTVVIDGHVDTAVDGPGALFHLRELRPGDPVVLDTDRGPQRYLIAALRSYLKADLPAAVFAHHGQPRLVIITCGGTFNEKTRQYAGNIVAYAVPASATVGDG